MEVDVCQLLESLGVKGLTRSGDWVNGLCPMHRDSNPSFGVNEKSQVYKCFVCGSGSLVDLVHKVTGMPWQEAVEYLYSFSSGAEPYKSEKIKEKISRILRGKEEAGLKVFSPEAITPWVGRRHPYFYERKIMEDWVYDYFHLGYASEYDSVVFPVFFLGDLVGVQGRKVNGEKPKYKPLPGFEFPTSRVFYHFRPEYDRVVLVEGVFDCIRLVSYGCPNVMALFGSHLSDEQAEMLKKNFKEVILWLDKDEAGIRGTIEAIKKIGKEVNTYVAASVEGKDPDAHTREEVVAVRKNLMTGTTFLMRRKLGRMG